MQPGQSLSYATFNRAVADVQSELHRAGLFFAESRLRHTEVVWCAWPQALWDAHGFFFKRVPPGAALLGYTAGNIYVPRSVLKEWLNQRRGSIRDVIRHEYGHALLWHYPRLIPAEQFRTVFSATQGDPGDYVSEYAATEPEEDFCETFMTWLRCVHSKSGGRTSLEQLSSRSRLLRGKFRLIQAACEKLASKGERQRD